MAPSPTLRGVQSGRQDMLATPLGLWNHLDIDFAAETEEIVPGSYTKNAKKVCSRTDLAFVLQLHDAGARQSAFMPCFI